MKILLYAIVLVLTLCAFTYCLPTEESPLKEHLGDSAYTALIQKANNISHLKQADADAIWALLCDDESYLYNSSKFAAFIPVAEIQHGDLIIRISTSARKVEFLFQGTRYLIDIDPVADQINHIIRNSYEQN